MANLCKFEKKQYKVSYDNGTTWYTVTPEQNKPGNMLEYDSQDCSSMEAMYRWRTLDGQYLCEDKEKYKKEIREDSVDGGVTWYTSYPTVYRMGQYVGTDETFCNDKFIGHYMPGEDAHSCSSGYYWNGYRCIKSNGGSGNNYTPGSIYWRHPIDPLKVVKCNDNSTLTSAETEYYSSGYILFLAEIGDCVTAIGDEAFRGRSSLSSITIPNSVTSIGNDAFYLCTSLTSVTVNATTPPTLVGSAVFNNTNNCPIYVPCESLMAYKSAANWSTYANRIKGIPPCTPIPTATTKVYTTYNDGDIYFKYCDASAELTSGETRPSGYAGSAMTSAVIGDCVTSIGSSAFRGCSSLSSVTIPSDVTSIGESAFSGCSSLTSVTVNATTPPTLKNYVFYDTNDCPIYVPCQSLMDYKMSWSIYTSRIQAIPPCTPIPTATTKVYTTYNDGDIYFKYCDNSTGLASGETRPSGYEYSAMTSVEIGECVTSIGNYAFSSCSSLSSVTIPSDVTSIGKSAFEGCSSLSAISIGDKVTSIGPYAFQRCPNLKDIYTGQITVPEARSTTFPSGVTIHVPCEGYLNWHQVFEVEHPDLGVRIAISGDSSCTETRWIESGTTCVGYDKYSRYIEQVRPISGGTWVNTGNESAATLIEADSIDCGGGWQYRWVESGTTCVGYDKWSQSIKQVSHDGGLTWENVSPAEYSATTLLEPNSEDCGYIPQSVKLQAYYTDNRADRIECDSTSAITNSDILNLTYPRAEMLEAEIGNCVTSIGNRAFASCSNLTTCTIGSGVTTIGSFGFSGCRSLTSIEIPNSVITISADVFYNCSSLSSCTIGNGVTTIGNEAFYGCRGLTDIIIGSGVTTFGNNAFYQTGHITNLTLYTPTVVEVGGWYSNPESITTITLGDNVTTLNESCFSHCTSLTSITIPNSVTSIGNYAFNYCSSLSSCTIGNGVTTIGYGAFNYCTSLTNIVIPNEVTFIDDSAFRNCTGLTSFTCLATTPPATGSYESHILDNTGNCPIYVPAASVETYKSARGWWSYASRIQPIS